MRKKIILCFTITALLSFSACGSIESAKNTEKTDISSVAAPEKEKNTLADSPAATPEMVSEKESFDMDVASGYYMSMGTYEESVAVNGPDRKEDQWSVSGKKIQFPQGAVRSVCVESLVKKARFVDVSEQEVRDFIDSIENAECKKYDDEIDPYQITANIVYLTSRGDFRTVRIRSLGAGYHIMKVFSDDKKDFKKEEKMLNGDTGKKTEGEIVYSKKLTKILKHWLDWKETSREELSDIASVTAYDAWDRGRKTELTEEEISVLKNVLDTAQEEKQVYDQTTKLECILKDGRKVCMGLSPYDIVMEGNQYGFDMLSNAGEIRDKLVHPINGRLSD